MVMLFSSRIKHRPNFISFELKIMSFILEDYTSGSHRPFDFDKKGLGDNMNFNT